MTFEIHNCTKGKSFEHDLNLFSTIRKAVMSLPDIDLGNDIHGSPILLNCHLLARATAQVFGLMYEDVWFVRRWNHTVVVYPRRFAIDVYPVGILSDPQGGPIFISATVYGSVYNSSYFDHEDGHIVTADFSGDEYLHGKVDLIARELAKHIN